MEICNNIGNEFFIWFQSTGSKSRINFLELLRTGQMDYVINEDALEYINNQCLPKSLLHLLQDHPNKQFTDLRQWEAHFRNASTSCLLPDTIGIKRYNANLLKFLVVPTGIEPVSPA